MVKKDFKDYKVFKCRGTKLKWFLLNNGESYIDISEDKKGKYWLFLRSDNLNKLLDKYEPYLG